jgi:hypothetical protein
MGVVFLKNTRFATTAAISGLAMLDTIDVETFDTNTFLQQTFNWKDYPFKNRWIEKEEGLLGGHATLETNKKLDDSLKTHPDCQDRIKAITPLVTATTNAGQQNFLISNQQFAQLKKSFCYEIVEHYFVNNNLSACLYFSAQLLKNNHNDPYLIATIGKLMSQLYIAQKNHRLSSCAQQPAPHNSSNYNNLLQFLQNLYLEEIASINYYFLQQYEQQLVSYEDYVFVLTVSKQQNNKPQEQAYWKNYYNKSFTPKKYSLN